LPSLSRVLEKKEKILFFTILSRVIRSEEQGKKKKKRRKQKLLFFAILSLVLGGKECGKGTT
jgi:hypothetical protein